MNAARLRLPFVLYALGLLGAILAVHVAASMGVQL